MSINTAGETWAEVHGHVERELSSLIEALQSPLLPHDESQYLRGRIAAYREVLNLPRLPAESEPLSFVTEDVI